MGGVCTLIREAGPNDSWVHEENATVTFDDGVEMLVSDFEATILAKNACRSSWSKFEPATRASLTAAYFVLIVFGSLGNGLVCYVVLGNCHMRTPRNLLILNLAASDLILCLFTQPFNLLKSSAASWKLGTAVCKLVPTVAGTNVFVSTFSITAIALDRFKLIVRPTDRDLLLQPVWSAAVLIGIWVLSLFLSSPMLIFNKLHHVKATDWLCVYEFCIEDPEYADWKMAYSMASMLIQYILPIAVLSVAHARICNKLRNRMKAGNHPPNPPNPPNPPDPSNSSVPTSDQGRTSKRKLLIFPWNSNLPDSKMEAASATPESEITSVRRSPKLQHPEALCTPDAAQGPAQDPPSCHDNLEVIQEQLPSSPATMQSSSSSSLKTRAQRMIKSLSPKRMPGCSKKSKPPSPSSLLAKNTTKAHKRRADRERKTNRLLMMIALLFAGSWMPLNIINIVADLNPELITSFDETGAVFAVCHLLVLGSACANPVLYGWLNENFQREFKRILCVRCSRCSRGGSQVGFCRGRCSDEAETSRGRGKSTAVGRAESAGSATANPAKNRKLITACGPPVQNAQVKIRQ